MPMFPKKARCMADGGSVRSKAYAEVTAAMEKVDAAQQSRERASTPLARALGPKSAAVQREASAHVANMYEEESENKLKDARRADDAEKGDNFWKKRGAY